MNPTTQAHPDRTELIQFARGVRGLTGKHSGKHFQDCSDCMTTAALLRRFDVSALPEFPETPQSWLPSIYTMVPKKSIPGKIKEYLGGLTFDSWTLPALAGVRAVNFSTQRHLRVEGPGVFLDLRGEKLKDGWEFIAQAGGEKLEDSFALARVGQMELLPDEHGFYHWTSKRPPRQITLETAELIFTSPLLSWQKKS